MTKTEMKEMIDELMEQLRELPDTQQMENRKMKFFEAIEKDKELSELRRRLEIVPDSYHDFVIGTLIYCYNNKAMFQKVKKYMDENPDADSSDITFIIE